MVSRVNASTSRVRCASSSFFQWRPVEARAISGRLKAPSMTGARPVATTGEAEALGFVHDAEQRGVERLDGRRGGRFLGAR